MNTKIVDVSEAQTHLTDFISLAQEGQEVILAQNNQPLVRLVPVDSVVKQPAQHTGKRVAGLGAGTMWVSDDFAEPLPDDFWRAKI